MPAGDTNLEVISYRIIGESRNVDADFFVVMVNPLILNTGLLRIAAGGVVRVVG